jgi:hypothetical protein
MNVDDISKDIPDRVSLEKTDPKELQAVAQWLLDNGYLKKVYGVEKVQQGDKTYYCAYYVHQDLLKWFGRDCVYNGLPIYVRPFVDEKDWYKDI